MNGSHILIFCITLTLAACNDGRLVTPANAQTVSGSSSGSAPPSSVTSASGTYTPAGNASTIEGVDSTGRGYRDDVAQLIDDKFSTDPQVKSAAIQMAKEYQESISSAAASMSDTSADLLSQSQADFCMFMALTVQQIDAADDANHAIYARTFNTDARMAARQQYLAKATNVVVLKHDSSKCSGITGVTP